MSCCNSPAGSLPSPFGANLAAAAAPRAGPQVALARAQQHAGLLVTAAAAAAAAAAATALPTVAAAEVAATLAGLLLHACLLQASAAAAAAPGPNAVGQQTPADCHPHTLATAAVQPALVSCLPAAAGTGGHGVAASRSFQW